MIFGSFMMVQPLLDSLLSFFPFYMEMKLLSIVYLIFPGVSKAETVFHLLFKPLLMKLSTGVRSIGLMLSDADTQAAADRLAGQRYNHPSPERPSGSASIGRRESSHHHNHNQISNNNHAPASSYHQGTSNAARRLTRSQSSKKCVVCTDSMDTDVQLNYGLPCSHAYHIKCIYKWMKTKRRNYQDMTCPECKYELEEEVYQDVKTMYSCMCSNTK
jgi:hypothetical protein